MAWKIVFSVLALLITTVYLYSKYIESQKDIHELALAQQSNINTSRKENETAIYRNILVPFEMPLVTGLSIRQGFKLRNGNLRDIWSVVFDQKHNRQERIVFVDDNTNVAGLNVSLDVINGAMKRLTQFFVHNDLYTIGITVPLYSYHGFLISLTCFTNSLTVHHFHEIPKTDKKVDLLVIDESQLDQIKNIRYKKLMVITKDTTTIFEHAINWNELGDFSELKDEIFDYKYDPKYDEGTPFVSTINEQTNEFTHQNFTSSIASIVKTIPLGHEFTTTDKFLLSGSNEPSDISKVLAVLLFGGNVILNTSSYKLESLVETHAPTIIAITPESAKTILSTSNNAYTSIWNQLKLLRAQTLLSEGVFTSFASSKLYESVRLLYISSSTKSHLSSSELNILRIFTGSRVITERFLPNVLGSILSSNFYDYRLLSNTKITNRGSPSLSLELKNFKYKDLNIDKRHGELCIRGFIIGKPSDDSSLQEAIKKGELVGSEGWMPTGVIGKFGNDGCFYEDN